jgi:hypothetical protein
MSSAARRPALQECSVKSLQPPPPDHSSPRAAQLAARVRALSIDRRQTGQLLADDQMSGSDAMTPFETQGVPREATVLQISAFGPACQRGISGRRQAGLIGDRIIGID